MLKLIETFQKQFSFRLKTKDDAAVAGMSARNDGLGLAGRPRIATMQQRHIPGKRTQNVPTVGTSTRTHPRENQPLRLTILSD